ncbi:hypothetical protein SETIT_5G084300v2 [Setaria italica]|uniref:SIAH-type domain-containing protein n=2 Tax=Setaria TaxID=4554 RepID=A0A368R2M4_SETIT|nr:hypothetical protein SETIT_5G084300v2 [Setaria italica]TKW13187.1 hypothetical protein SEVIR_5G083000v2 [Setaria viridis]
MAEEQPKRLLPSPSGESSKTTKVLSAPCCPGSSAGVKEEPGEGEAAHGGGGSRAGAAVAEHASPGVERPRIDISIDAQLLHCAITECNRPLKPPIFKCEAGHLLCGACRSDRRDEGHCRRCGGATAFAHCGPELDLYVGDARVPCPFRAYGCRRSVAYHATAAHQDACPYAPCHCAVPGCPFTASPPRLRDHLAFDHAWPLDRLPGYGKPHPLRVPAGEPHHLLVVEGDERRLFALCVRPRGAASLAVSVSCVRTAAAAEAGPRFTCMLWAQTPAPAAQGAPAGGKGRRLMMEADVASCAVPGGTAVEEGMALYVPPPMLNGPAKEMNIRVRIDVLDPAPASLRSANASSRKA